MTPQELVAYWNTAAPRQFNEEAVERQGRLTFALLRPLTEGKKGVVREGAKLIGYRVKITKGGVEFFKSAGAPR